MLSTGNITHLMILFLLSASALQSSPVARLVLERCHPAALQPNVIIVPDNYSTIKEAISAADPGDTVQVRSGTYCESLVINKTISLIGENPETTIIDGSKANETFAPVITVFEEQATNVKVCNFTVTGSNAWGIYLAFKASAWIENNIVTNNSGGMVADFSDHNTIVNNTIAGNKFEGLVFMDSRGNTMRNNTMNGNSHNFGFISPPFDHDIDMSNSVNGKPIYYLRNQSDLSISPATFPNIGYLALINCTNITVQNLTFQNNYNGLLLSGTANSTVRNNSFESNSKGLEMIDSPNNTIEANDITGNTWQGVTINQSPNNTFRSNRLINNQNGLDLSGDSLNDFTQDIDTSNTADTEQIRYLINHTDLTINPSTFSNVAYLALVNCRNITVRNLTFQHNELLVAFTQNSSITENTLTNGSISLTHSSNINLNNNTMIDGETAISLSHSDNNTVARNTITKNTDWGIALETSSDNTIFGNDVRDNEAGMNLVASSSNTVFQNNITGHRDYGLLLRDSSYNLLYHNNLINHIPYQAVSSSSNGQPFSDNDFDNGYPSGGNYWSDYNGTDLYNGQRQNETGSDGIGDTRYTSFFSIVDHYPLMQPIESFETSPQEKGNNAIEVVSNSTVSGFELDAATKTVRFNVTGQEGTAGFSRIIVPSDIIQDLWTGNYSVTINAIECPFRNWTDTQNTYIYVSYTHSEHEIAIVPELPEKTALIILIVPMILTTFAAKKLKRFISTTSRANWEPS